MRNALLVASVSTFGLLFAAACGTTTIVTTAPPPEEGASSSSGSLGEGGSSSGDGTSSSGSSGKPGSSSGASGSSGTTPTGPKLPAAKQLKGGDVILLGVAGTDAIALVLAADSASLEAFPIAGGASTVIVPAVGQSDTFSVRGGAVGIFSGLNADKIGTLGVWTRANGLKADLTTSALAGFFSASADGTRIAFSVNATTTATDLAVTGSASPVATAVLSGANAVNLAAENCTADIRFAGNRLFGAYCTGTAADTTRAQLVTVAATGTTAQQLAANTDDTTSIQPFWLADKTGANVFVIGSAAGTPASQARVISVGATPTTTSIDDGVADGFILDDGSALVYRKGASIKRAVLGGLTVTPTTLVATDVKALLATSTDKQALLFRSLDPAGQNELVDIKVSSSSKANSAVTLVPTATTMPLGFTPNGDNVLYLGDITQSAKLKLRPAAGGAEKTLAATSVGAAIPQEGTGVVSLDNLKQQQGFYSLDLQFVDVTGAPAVNGGVATPLAATVPDGEFIFAGKKLVYTSLDTKKPGLFVIELP